MTSPKLLSRRAFVRMTSGAGAVLLGGVPWFTLRSLTVEELLPAPDDALLRELALKAVDAARSAGASFADVRINFGREFAFGGLLLDSKVGCGVRAVVDGAWGFVGGYELTSDGVTRVARAAVERARANRPRKPRTLDLAPIDVVTNGYWATPIIRDPFTVPVGEARDLMAAAVAAAQKVSPRVRPECGFIAGCSHRAFASTEGTSLIQRVDWAWPRALVSVYLQDGFVSRAQVETLGIGGYGYEGLADANLLVELPRAAKRALAGARQPPPAKSIDVGRYDLVCSASVVGDLLARTVAAAVKLDLALGYEANGAGTSYAAPPEEMLGRYQMGSPLLTLKGDRTQPHGAATVGWDDEGVLPDAYTFVQDGVLVDYHTNRQLAPRLADWYRQRGRPVRSHGCASYSGQSLPEIHLPNLIMQPGRENVTLDDLIVGTKRGLYLAESGGGGLDQQLLSGQFTLGDQWTARMIRNGRLGDYVRPDVAYQFLTPSLWRSLDMVGGLATGRHLTRQDATGDYRDPLGRLEWNDVFGVWAVPARFRQVNVLGIGRTL